MATIDPGVRDLYPCAGCGAMLGTYQYHSCPGRMGMLPMVPPTIPTNWPMQSRPLAQGWECPRCRKVNAPGMPQCPCNPPLTLEGAEE